MNLKPSIFGEKWGQRIASAGIAVAKMAGYDAGQPTITRKQQSRYNTNPNTAMAQVERVAMQWNAEYLAKNSALGIGYLRQRINYCSPLGWMPNTGSNALNGEIKQYCEEQWKDMGINCSMYEAFSRSAHVELPVRGDSCLIWYRDEDRLRLIEASADQIGELYVFTAPFTNAVEGLTYFSGMYFRPSGIRAGFKIYERGFNQVYTNPQDFPASDVIYFQDNLMRGIRGITKFHGTIMSLTKSDVLFQFGMDNAQKQAKTAVVVRNNIGGPMEPDYDIQTRVNEDGSVVYLERSIEGAATEFQYNGDGYELIQTTSPGPELIEGCRYADERSCLSLGMPYSFIVNARDVGGASVRLEIVGKAGKEIERICRITDLQFEKIAYVTIMDGYDRGAFGRIPAKYLRNLTRGETRYPNLPSADAFRESKDDIICNRAGLDSRQRILGRYREDWHDMLGELKQEAIDIAKAVQDANRQLAAEVSPIDGKPYDPTIDEADIAANSDNPQQSAQAEEIASGGAADKSQSSNPAPARMAAFMGDIEISSLPEDCQKFIKSIHVDADASAKVSKFGMVASELEKMSDPHNLESAKKNLKYCSGESCAEEVHANSEKHVLVNNGRVIDGHHFIAKALKGKVSKSLPVIDLSPIRFQQARTA